MHAVKALAKFPIAFELRPVESKSILSAAFIRWGDALHSCMDRELWEKLAFRALKVEGRLGPEDDETMLTTPAEDAVLSCIMRNMDAEPGKDLHGAVGLYFARRHMVSGLRSLRCPRPESVRTALRLNRSLAPFLGLYLPEGPEGFQTDDFDAVVKAEDEAQSQYPYPWLTGAVMNCFRASYQRWFVESDAPAPLQYQYRPNHLWWPEAAWVQLCVSASPREDKLLSLEPLLHGTIVADMRARNSLSLDMLELLPEGYTKNENPSYGIALARLLRRAAAGCLDEVPNKDKALRNLLEVFCPSKKVWAK